MRMGEGKRHACACFPPPLYREREWSQNKLEHQNHAVGNAGPILYSDFIWPVLLGTLLWLTNREQAKEPEGLMQKHPQE